MTKTMIKSYSSPCLSSHNSQAFSNLSGKCTSSGLVSAQPRMTRSNSRVTCIAEEYSSSMTAKDCASARDDILVFNRRHVLSSAAATVPSAVKKAVDYSAKSTAVWYCTSKFVWPMDEGTMCQVAETCMKTRSAVGFARDTNMFYVNHLFQNVVSFYENLFSQGINTDHFVLRLIYQHVVAVIEHVKVQESCTEDALLNFDKMRKAMEIELDRVYQELYRSPKTI